MPWSFELLRTANVGSFFLVMLGSWTPAPFFDASAADLVCFAFARRGAEEEAARFFA